MTNYLDPLPTEQKRFIPPSERSRKFRPGIENENLEALNNDERKEVTKDFSDSPALKNEKRFGEHLGMFDSKIKDYTEDPGPPYNGEGE